MPGSIPLTLPKRKQNEQKNLKFSEHSNLVFENKIIQNFMQLKKINNMFKNIFQKLEKK